MRGGQIRKSRVELDEFAYFFQRKSQRLAPFNENNSLCVRLAVVSITGRRSGRFTKESLAFVEADTLDIYSCLDGQLFDAHECDYSRRIA